MTTKEMGDIGEAYALTYLKKKGYEIVQTNYRYLRGEVDIICKDEDEYVFVEVKTRQTAAIGEPWRAVTKSKQRQIIRCAHNFIIQRNLDVNSRFDIVSIVHNSAGTFLEHIDHAFVAT